MSTHPGTPDTDTPPSVQAAPTDTGPDHREPDREFRHIEALAACAARGDRDCLGELYELTVDQVFRFLHMRTCNVHLAEDLTSDTWLHAAPMYDLFTSTPDYTPYERIPRRWPETLNSEDDRSRDALISESYDWSEPDNQPGLSRMLWRHFRGTEPPWREVEDPFEEDDDD